MQIHKILTKFFITLTAFTILGLISMIPMDKYQKSYMEQRQKIQASPQINVEATEKYVEAVEEGVEDTSKGIQGHAPKKYYSKVLQKKSDTKRKFKIKTKKHRKPLFVRDKKNPKILRRYKSK